MEGESTINLGVRHVLEEKAQLGLVGGCLNNGGGLLRIGG